MPGVIIGHGGGSAARLQRGAPRARLPGCGGQAEGRRGVPGPRGQRGWAGGAPGVGRTWRPGLREPGSGFAGIFSAAAAGLYLGPHRPLTFAVPLPGPRPGPRLRRAVWDVRYVRAAPSPVSAESLALFSVWMSSPRLFLSPFIFQLPPTKNFLGAMAGTNGSGAGTGGDAKVSGGNANGDRRLFYSPEAAETTPPACPAPNHASRQSPAPCPTRALPRPAGVRQEPGGFFDFYFVPRVFWHVKGTQGETLLVARLAACPTPSPDRAGRRNPPFTSHTYTQAPSSPSGQQGGGIIPPSSEALGLCVTGVRTVRTFPIETDIPNPPNPLTHVHGGSSPQSISQ